MTGVIVLVVLLVLAGGFGWWRTRADGRLRVVGEAGLPSSEAGTAELDDAGHERLSAAEVGTALGPRATLLQFSSAFCAPCRTTRVVLADVAETVPGVRHVEIDAESHLELVRRLDVRRTPTTLLLDGDGVVRRRASGVPRRDDVVGALGTFL